MKSAGGSFGAPKATGGRDRGKASNGNATSNRNATRALAREVSGVTACRMERTRGTISKRGRRIHPQDQRLFLARIRPAMLSAAFEIKAVACLEAVGFTPVETNFQASAQDVQKFLALVRVGFAASGGRRNAEEVGLHHRLSPSEQLHTDAGACLENFSVRWPDAARIRFRRIEEREDVHAVEAGEPAQRCDRCAHLAAFECAQKSHRHFGSLRDARERITALDSQTAQARPD